MGDERRTARGALGAHALRAILGGAVALVGGLLTPGDAGPAGVVGFVLGPWAAS
ncbi:MAG: hypothetical protein M3426_16850 [Actinomycetota bacterium]|nr:hypothetical protein [Actinomycetota bacterium]